MQSFACQGVGAWQQVQARLPHNGIVEIQTQASLLLGCRELTPYLGWRPSKCGPHASACACAAKALRLGACVVCLRRAMGRPAQPGQLVPALWPRTRRRAGGLAPRLACDRRRPSLPAAPPATV